jgi:hypothetical protein
MPKHAKIWLLLILLLGLGIRLVGFQWGQGYFYFGQGDGIAAYSAAVDYAKGDARAQFIGQPNYNAHSKLPGPLWTLFCFLGLRVGGTIEGVMLALILLNTATIYLAYLLAERTLGSPASLWAALFAATLPSMVFYSMGVYNPGVMTFLGACLFLALWEVIRRERSRHIFWLGVILLMMPQFHMSGMMLWPAVGVILALSSVRLNVPWLLGGLIAGVSLYVPYLAGEMAHGWQNTYGMVSGADGRSWDSLKAITVPLNFLVNWVPQCTRGAAEYRELGIACFGSFGLFLAINLLSAVVAGFLIVGAFQQGRAAARGFWREPRAVFNRTPGILFLAFLLLIPLLCALLSGKPFHARYALVLFPLLLALAGGAVAKWLLAPRVGPFFAAALVVTTCVNIWFMPALYWHQGTRIDRGEVFVPGFRKLEAVYQKLKVHAGTNRCVRVEDAAYLHSLPATDKVLRDAGLISLYIAVREKEFVMLAGKPGEPVIYGLCRADEVTPGDTRIAYQGNGIALIAKTPSP